MIIFNLICGALSIKEYMKLQEYATL